MTAYLGAAWPLIKRVVGPQKRETVRVKWAKPKETKSVVKLVSGQISFWFQIYIDRISSV